MINDSTLTAQSIKDRLTTERSEPVSNPTVRLAINYLIDIVDGVRWENDKAAMRKRTPVLAIDANGYDLTQITDLGETEAGFQVLEDGDKRKELHNVGSMSLDRGYFIEGETLYLNKASNAQIVYLKSNPHIVASDNMEQFTLPFPRRLDKAVYTYLMETFYDGSFEFEKRNDARNQFIQEVRRVFTVKKRVDII